VKSTFELVLLYAFPQFPTVKQTIPILAIAYLLIFFYFGSRWLIFARNNLKSTPDEVFLSLIVLLLVTIFFPFTIPFYLYQIVKKQKLNNYH
jgi:hypothetical protein